MARRARAGKTHRGSWAALVFTGSGAAVTCECCVLRKVISAGDHSPHPRLVWDLLMSPVASEQFLMCVSNWRRQISALQNRVGRPPRSSPQGRGFPVPPPTFSLPWGSAPTEPPCDLQFVEIVRKSSRLSSRRAPVQGPARERSEGPLH